MTRQRHHPLNNINSNVFAAVQDRFAACRRSRRRRRRTLSFK